MGGEKAGADTRPFRLLLVDDNQDMVNMLGALLRRVGHEVFVACDGPSALAAATQKKPEVIVLDIGLPGMDGYELAGELKKQPGLEHVCLVAMTGRGEEEDVRRAEQAGFHYHLLKPVRLEDITRVLLGCDALAKSH